MLDDVLNIRLPSDDVPAKAVQRVAPAPQVCELLAAAGDSARWGILRELAGGEALSVQELAARVARSHNQTSKHLSLLRSVGAVVAVELPGMDGRKQFHAIAEAFRRVGADGKPEIDYGTCVLRFP